MKKVLFLVFASLAVFTQAQDVKEIIRKADEKMRGKSSISEMTVKIVRPTWSRSMTMKTWTLGTEYSMTYMVTPAKDRGTVFLKRKMELWNWVPSIERTIKMPPSMLAQSWMGTDMTNDDLVKQTSNVDDFEHKLLGEETIEGRKCWKIEMIPHEDVAVVWGKIIVWVDQTDDIYMKNEFYDEDNYLVNTMNAKSVKELGGRLMATVLEVIPAEDEGHKTILTYNSMQFDVELKESFFTVQNMKRVK